MNKDLFISRKIAELNGEYVEPMSDEMAEYLASHAELQQELDFIAQFWAPAIENQQPSPQLRANFYQMLSQAQAAQTDINKPAKPTWLANFNQWFAPKYWVQLAGFALVFFVGYSFNQQPQANQTMASLQKEVSSLSSLLAVSMLNQPTASERLMGVAYSQQTDLSDPLLMSTLIDLLSTEHSMSVRLAILRTLEQVPQLESNQQELLDLTVKETNVLVQISLCRLLLNQSNTELKQTLISRLNEQELHPDVAKFIEQVTSASQI